MKRSKLLILAAFIASICTACKRARGNKRLRQNKIQQQKIVLSNHKNG